MLPTGKRKTKGEEGAAAVGGRAIRAPRPEGSRPEVTPPDANSRGIRRVAPGDPAHVHASRLGEGAKGAVLARRKGEGRAWPTVCPHSAVLQDDPCRPRSAWVSPLPNSRHCTLPPGLGDGQRHNAVLRLNSRFRSQTMSKELRTDVYARVTAKIVTDLEQASAPG